MQNILPVSGQNSRLFTVVTQGRVMMYFAFADYEKNTSLSRYTIQPLPSDFSITDLDDIIQDLLVTWGADMGLDLRSDTSGIVKAIFYNSSQIGGTSLVLDDSYYQESYKSRVLSCIATRMGDEERMDYASKYMKTFKPTDLLWVNLDWDKISVILLSKIGGQESQDVDVREFSIENNLTHKDTAKQLQNVVGIHLEKDSIRNILANVLYRQIMTSTSTEVWDVIRSFITTSLIKVKDPVFKNFGMKTNDAHLMITGDIASVLSPETLFISVSDGLQLRGRYRVILDQDQVSIILGEALASKNFVLPVADIFKNRFLYISSESDVRTHEGDLSFNGRIESNQGEEGVSEKEIIGQIGYFHTFDLGGTGRILIDPTNAVFFPNLEREGKYVVANYSNNDDRLVVDCRKIPVVYGPDESSNLVRIKTWINGLKLTKM